MLALSLSLSLITNRRTITPNPKKNAIRGYRERKKKKEHNERVRDEEGLIFDIVG